MKLTRSKYATWQQFDPEKKDNNAPKNEREVIVDNPIPIAEIKNDTEQHNQPIETVVDIEQVVEVEETIEEVKPKKKSKNGINS